MRQVVEEGQLHDLALWLVQFQQLAGEHDPVSDMIHPLFAGRGWVRCTFDRYRPPLIAGHRGPVVGDAPPSDPQEPRRKWSARGVVPRPTAPRRDEDSLRDVVRIVVAANRTQRDRSNESTPTREGLLERPLTSTLEGTSHL